MNNHTFLNAAGTHFNYNGQNLNPAYNEANTDHFIPGDSSGGGQAQFTMIKKTVGLVGVPGCDLNFAAAADHLLQSVDLGLIIPAKAKVRDVQIVCVESVVGVTDFQVKAGANSGGSDYMAAGSCNVLNEVKPATSFIGIDWANATHVWLSGDPTDFTWNAMTAGKWEIYVYFQQF